MAQCHASCHEGQSSGKFALDMIKQAIQYIFSLIAPKKTGPFQGIVRSKEKKNKQERSEIYPYCLSSHAQSSPASYFALHDSLRDTGPSLQNIPDPGGDPVDICLGYFLYRWWIISVFSLNCLTLPIDPAYHSC